MQVAVRPNLAAAGAALIGASVVAASSITPLPDVHLPDIHAPAVIERAFDVSLAAASDPLAAYSQVLQTALNNINSLIESAEPGQVLSDVLANQSANLGAALGAVGSTGGAVLGAVAQVPQVLLTAAGQLAAGNISGATNALLELPLQLALPLTGLLPALTDLITKPVQNVLNVINAFTSDQLGTTLALAGFIGPLISTPAAAAVAVQNVLTAVVSLNPAAIVNAVLQAPATIADGLINGGYGPNLGPLAGLTGINVVAGGLLAATGLTIGDDGSLTINTGGPLAGLQQVLAKIALAIAPPAAAATTVQIAATDATSIPSATPHTLSLVPAAAPATDATEAPAKAATEASEAEAPAKDATEAPAKDATEAPAKDATEAPAKDTSKDATEAPAKDATEAPAKDTSKDTTTKDATEAPTKDAPKDTKDASTSKPAKDVDVKGGNKVEPTKSTAADASKAGDAKPAAEAGAASGESHADGAASASSKDAA